MARQRHIHGVAGVVERVGALIDKDDVGIRLKNRFDGRESAPVVHGAYRGGIGKTFGEFLILNLGLGLKRGYPGRVSLHFAAFQSGEDGVERQTDVAHNRSGNRHVDVNLLRLHVELYELGVGVPFAAAEGEHPVQTGADDEHYISLFHDV